MQMNQNQKSWNRENKYNLDYRIGFTALNPSKGISLPAFMAMVQEASLMHTYHTPQSLKYYDDHDWAWIITHWQVEIDELPQVGETVNISTWPVGFKGFFGERAYEAINAEGKSILRANSNWILLNRENLKPVRPNEEIAEKYGQKHPFPIKKDFSMPKIDNFNFISSHPYKVLRRDIDTNRHVNNANYLYWIYNYLPQEFYTDYSPKLLKVSYKKEMLLNDEAYIEIHQNSNEIFAIIKKDGQVATEVYIEFS